ncbi:MAG: hypothetical protein ACLQHS_19395 [Candidatus Limnocylindrales bacterium]
MDGAEGERQKRPDPLIEISKVVGGLPSYRLVAALTGYSPRTWKRSGLYLGTLDYTVGADRRCRPANEPTRRAVAVRLVQLAAEHPGWSARQLAREVRCSPTTASKYCRGWTVTNG